MSRSGDKNRRTLKDVTANEQPLVWHYIGHIQRNKTKELAAHFDWGAWGRSLNYCQRLNEQSEHLAPLNICIEVNIDDEASKSGCQPDQLRSGDTD
ncbi:MAG: hypothetical protein U1E92_03850 [Moraxella osloensis]